MKMAVRNNWTFLGTVERQSPVAVTKYDPRTHVIKRDFLYDLQALPLESDLIEDIVAAGYRESKFERILGPNGEPIGKLTLMYGKN